MFYSVENLVEKPVGKQDKTHEFNPSYSLFHIEISGKISQNTFLTRQERTSETSPFCRVRKVFLAYFSRNRDMNAIYHVSLTFRVIFWAFLSNFCSPEKQV